MRGDLKGLLALHPDSFVVDVVITAVVLSSVLNQVSSFLFVITFHHWLEADDGQ